MRDREQVQIRFDPADFVGLPVVCRIPGDRYGEKVGAVLGAFAYKDGIVINATLTLDGTFDAMDSKGFSIGEFKEPSANFGFIDLAARKAASE